MTNNELNKDFKIKTKDLHGQDLHFPRSTLWHWKRLLRDQVPLASKMKAKSVYLYKTH